MTSKVKLFAGIAAIVVVAAITISYFNPITVPKDRGRGVLNMHATGYSMSGYYQRVQGIPIPDSTDFRIAVDTDFPFSKLKVGDPVIFRHRFNYAGDFNLVHHLVWEFSPDHKAFRAKGYYNMNDDGVWIDEKDFVGKATHIWLNDVAVPLKDQ